MKDNTIDSFRDDYFFLSNMYRTQDGSTVEHKYQASKAVYKEDYDLILNASSPFLAKKLSRKIKLRDDWEKIKDVIMFSLVLYKFTDDVILRDKLLATENSSIIEGNDWHDNYWGDCTCEKCEHIKGKNKLGKIYMRIRKMLSNIYEEDIGNLNDL